MSKIIPFDANSALPAHLAEKFGFANDELTGGVGTGYPVISYKGKVWHVNEGDNKVLVTRPGEEDTPAPYLDVVLIKANPHLSKVYYAGGYQEGSSEKPSCYSNDGVKPGADATDPQCATCAACPHNAWGSRITENGAKGKACSDSRRMAVVPAGELARPMLLRVPAGSLKDLVAYADLLNRRKTPYQAVVTRIGFDHTVAHQKFTFKPMRWLNPEEAEQVAETMAMDVVGQIVGITARGSAVAQGEAQAAKITPKATTPAVAKPAAPAAPTAAAKPAPKAAKVSEAEVVDVIGGEEPSKPVTKAPLKSKTQALISEADAELDAALAQLDD